MEKYKKDKLKKLAGKQAVTVTMSIKALNASDNMKKLNILNVFKLNIYQMLISMHRIFIFLFLQFSKVDLKEFHLHILLRFRVVNYNEKSFKHNQTKFSILSRCPRLWNKILRTEEKNIPAEYLFKKKTRETIFLSQNEIVLIVLTK